MPNFQFSDRSLKVLDTVHPDLIELMLHAIRHTQIDFVCYHGIRTLKEQKKFFAAGKSRTMNSRHLTGHAIDIAPLQNGEIPWDNWLPWLELAEGIKDVASEFKIPFEWGGDWGMRDGPHFQLRWDINPANEEFTPGFAGLMKSGKLLDMRQSIDLPEWDRINVLPSVVAVLKADELRVCTDAELANAETFQKPANPASNRERYRKGILG